MCWSLEPLDAGGDQLLSPWLSPGQALEEGGTEGAWKVPFSENNWWPGRPGLAPACPSISLSKYLEGGKVSRSFCALRSALVQVLALILTHSGCSAALPAQSPGDVPALSQATPTAALSSASWEPGILGLAPCLPSLPISHQTWKVGEGTGGGTDCRRVGGTLDTCQGSCMAWWLVRCGVWVGRGCRGRWSERPEDKARGVTHPRDPPPGTGMQA